MFWECSSFCVCVCVYVLVSSLELPPVCLRSLCLPVVGCYWRYTSKTYQHQLGTRWTVWSRLWCGVHWFVCHSLDGCLYLTLPYLPFGAGAQDTPALRPRFGPSAQPRQTSWLKKSPRGFCKPQENCPVDTVKSVQWECVITEDRSSE